MSLALNETRSFASYKSIPASQIARLSDQEVIGMREIPPYIYHNWIYGAGVNYSEGLRRLHLFNPEQIKIISKSLPPRFIVNLSDEKILDMREIQPYIYHNWIYGAGVSHSEGLRRLHLFTPEQIKIISKSLPSRFIENLSDEIILGMQKIPP